MRSSKHGAARVFSLSDTSCFARATAQRVGFSALNWNKSRRAFDDPAQLDCSGISMIAAWCASIPRFRSAHAPRDAMRHSHQWLCGGEHAFGCGALCGRMPWPLQRLSLDSAGSRLYCPPCPRLGRDRHRPRTFRYVSSTRQERPTLRV